MGRTPRRLDGRLTEAQAAQAATGAHLPETCLRCYLKDRPLMRRYRELLYDEAVAVLISCTRRYERDRECKFTTYVAASINECLFCKGPYFRMREQRWHTVQLSAACFPGGDPVQFAAPAPAVESIRQHPWLNVLSGRQRQVVVWRLEEGLEFPDMAALLNVSRQRVHQIFSQAVGRLRKAARRQGWTALADAA